LLARVAVRAATTAALGPSDGLQDALGRLIDALYGQRQAAQVVYARERRLSLRHRRQLRLQARFQIGQVQHDIAPPQSSQGRRTIDGLRAWA
jgi:hypothetical protein